MVLELQLIYFVLWLSLGRLVMKFVCRLKFVLVDGLSFFVQAELPIVVEFVGLKTIFLFE